MNEKETLLTTKRSFSDCCCNNRTFSLWCSKCKCFESVHLRCTDLKRISKISTLPLPGNISADAHALVLPSLPLSHTLYVSVYLELSQHNAAMLNIIETVRVSVIRACALC